MTGAGRSTCKPAGVVVARGAHRVEYHALVEAPSIRRLLNHKDTKLLRHPVPRP